MKIIVLNEELEQVSILSSYESLSFNRQFNNVGSFEIRVNINLKNAQELQPDRVIYLSPNQCGVIEKVEVSRSSNSNNEILVATGIEIKDLIGRRITEPPLNEETNNFVEVKTEQIVRDLLNDHVISPVNTDRKMDIFELGSFNDLGSVTVFSTKYKMLDSEVYQRLADDDLGLLYSADLIRKKVEMTVSEGMNRTINQSENPTAVFALKLGTSSKTIILNDKQAYKNIVYAGGKGEGLDREIIVYPETDIPKGINRREYFRDGRNAENTEELLSIASASLSEYKVIYQVNATASNNVDIEYNLGDKVTFMDYRTNAYENLQLTGIVDTLAKGATHQRTLIFGRSPLSIAQAINSRLSGVNNILTQ